MSTDTAPELENSLRQISANCGASLVTVGLSLSEISRLLDSKELSMDRRGLLMLARKELELACQNLCDAKRVLVRLERLGAKCS